MPAPTEAGHAIRATRVGASEVGALVEPGSHPYTTPADIYARIVEGVQRAPTGSTRMRLGNDLEAYVARRWRERTGLPIMRAWLTYPHRSGLPLSATPDYYVPHDALLEVKVDRGGWADEWVDVPRYVYWQVVAQLACTDRRAGHIGALVGSELRAFVVERDAAGDDELRMLEAVQRFAVDHLRPRVPPEPIPDELVLVVAPRPADVGDADETVDQLGAELAGVMALGREVDASRDDLRGRLARHMAAGGIKLLRGTGWRAEVRQSPNGRQGLYVYTDGGSRR